MNASELRPIAGAPGMEMTADLARAVSETFSWRDPASGEMRVGLDVDAAGNISLRGYAALISGPGDVFSIDAQRFAQSLNWALVYAPRAQADA